MLHFLLAAPADLRLYRRLLGQVLPYRRRLLVSLLAMIVLAIADAAKAAILRPLLDGAFIDQDPNLMRVIPLLLVGLFLLSGVATFVSGSLLHDVANRVLRDLKAAMHERLIALPASWYDGHSSGSVVSRFTYDVEQLREATTNAILVMVKDSLVMLGLISWMFYLDIRMTVITLLGGPFILLVAFFIRRRLREMSGRVQGAMAELNRLVNESIGANRIIRLFGGQDHERRRFARVIEEQRHYTMKFVYASTAGGPAVQLIAAIALAIIIAYATGAAAEGRLSVGTFVSFFAALVMMLDALRRLVKVNEYIQKGLAASESVFNLLDEPVEPDTGDLSPDRLRGEIAFRDVVFSYDGSTPVLDHLSLEIAAGETVALVGHSGSGKTTLAALLPRFYIPVSGSILIDGIDIQQLTLKSLRRQIGIVTQDVMLFDDTVRNNIAYGEMANADEQAIIEAARAAHALEFIERLPDGFDTMIGEKGNRLSGGQRQRLALARALLCQAPILVLDEATSALDTHSERHIREALESIRHRHTCLIIAHRLSTVEQADRIVVMDHGKIVESGTHTGLLKQGGAYARLQNAAHAAEPMP